LLLLKSESQQHPSQIDREQTAWIASRSEKDEFYIGTCAWKIKLRGMQAKPGKMYKMETRWFLDGVLRRVRRNCVLSALQAWQLMKFSSVSGMASFGTALIA